MSGAKPWDLKLRTYALWTPHKEHTKSAIRKDHLAPCRFNCWTNQISIGISQPLAQLQCRYNVEIPRVSLHLGQAKWDFRTDSLWHIQGKSIYLVYTRYIPWKNFLGVPDECYPCQFRPYGRGLAKDRPLGMGWVGWQRDIPLYPEISFWPNDNRGLGYPTPRALRLLVL